MHSVLNVWKYWWRCFPEDLEAVWPSNFLCRKLPCPTSDPCVCPPSLITPSSPPPALSPSPQPAQAGLTEIDWSTCWIFDRWMLEKLLSCETRSFDRISQPGVIKPSANAGVNCQLVCFVLRHDIMLHTDKGFLEMLTSFLFSLQLWRHSTFSRLVDNYFDNWLVISVIFQVHLLIPAS